MLMGVLAPGSAHARPSARPPIDMSGNFPQHMSTEAPSYIPPNLSEVSEPRRAFENTPFCTPKYSIVHGVEGFPSFFRVWNPHTFF